MGADARRGARSSSGRRRPRSRSRGSSGSTGRWRAATPSSSVSALLAAALAVPPIIAAAYATSDGAAPAHGRRDRLGRRHALSALLIVGLVRRALDGERGGIPALGVAGRHRRAHGDRPRPRPAAPRSAGRATGCAPARRPGPDRRGVLGAPRVRRRARPGPGGRPRRGRRVRARPARRRPPRRGPARPSAGRSPRPRAAAPSSGSPRTSASAVDEVEALLLARRSIVLEEMGLLAGLEWLAERTEDRSDVRVEILVDGGPAFPSPGAAPPARPPRDVERAAFRVTQLALDNVVRHAPGASVSVRLAATRATSGCGSWTTARAADRRGGCGARRAARARGHARRGAGVRRRARRRPRRRTTPGRRSGSAGPSSQTRNGGCGTAPLGVAPGRATVGSAASPRGIRPGGSGALGVSPMSRPSSPHRLAAARRRATARASPSTHSSSPSSRSSRSSPSSSWVARSPSIISSVGQQHVAAGRRGPVRASGLRQGPDHPAVDRDDRPGHERRRGRQQERPDPADLRRLAVPPERDRRLRPRLDLLDA